MNAKTPEKIYIDIDIDEATRRKFSNRALGRSTRKLLGRLVKGGVKAIKSKFKEQYNIDNIIVSYLLDEGYTKTINEAQLIMLNMSEKWKNFILD